MTNTILDYIKQEYERILQEQKERKPVYKLSNGDNIVIIDLTQQWRTINTKYGEKVVIPIYSMDKKEYVIMINPNSKLYKSLIKNLYNYIERNKNKELYLVPVKITRMTVNDKHVYDVEIIETNNNDSSSKRVKK